MEGKMLSELIRELQEIYDTEGDMICIYTQDDEGNDYRTVAYEPSIMYWDNFNGDIYKQDDVCEEDGYEKVVCIN